MRSATKTTMLGYLLTLLIALFLGQPAGAASRLAGQRPADGNTARTQRPADGGRARTQRPPIARAPQRSDLTPARPPIRDAVEGFYINRIQRELQLSNDQFARILPQLRKSLERRNELAQRQVRARDRLRQALQQGGRPNIEIAELRKELDETNSALRSVQEEFFTDVDPHLTEEQRANLRIVLPNLENRIRNMIERSRNPARGNEP